MTKEILILFSILFFSIVGMAENSKSKPTLTKEEMTFSNTQIFDSYLLHKADETPLFLTEKDIKNISLAPPPKNTSKQTKTELHTLIEYKKLRTPDRIKEIRYQRSLYGSDMCIMDIADFSNEDVLNSLTLRSVNDANIVLTIMKKKFNRVRPHFLNPDIDPVIAVPRHPAYPSGHSTESYVLAHIYSYIAPEYETCFFEKAAAIAKNREVAGLHYPSDSAAGKALAEQLFPLFKKSPAWLELAEQARKSYIANKDTMLARWKKNE